MRYRAILLALLFVLAQYTPLAAKDEKWFELSSEHFLLFTDAGEAKGRKLLGDFETRVAVFEQVFGSVPARPFPIEILVFKNEEDFIDAVPLPPAPAPGARGMPPGTQPLAERPEKAAYMLRGPDRIFIVARDKSPEDIAKDAGHALGHALFERYVLWRPFWLAEGAAEYLRNVGRPADTKKISEEDGFSAGDIVSIVPSANYNDQDPGGAFRSQSYRLVRILLDENPGLLKQYLQTLRVEGEAVPKIQIDADALDAKLKSYVETPLKAPGVAPAIKSVEAETGRLAIHRGDLLLAAGRDAAASRWYNADSADAKIARAIITRFARSPLEATRALDRASREAPQNGLVQYHFGALQIQDKKDVLLQVAALERAVRLVPLMGRAYAELARVYNLTGQADKALPLIARAVELEPEFGDHFYELRADTHVALNQFDQAFKDINIAAALPHADRSVVERYVLKISDVRRKIENARREIDARRLEQIRKDANEEAAFREPPPKPTPPPPPVPTGRISYEIEARARIEVVEAIYPDYPEALRKKGSAGNIALRVDVGPDGKVKTAAIATSQLPDLNTATLEAVKKWSFTPGNRSIRIIVTYSLQ